MEESPVHLGKFFFIRHKPSPNFLLEVENGATDEGTFVTVSEPDLLSGHESIDHQLWYYDRVTHTVCTKQNDFCLQMNGMMCQCYYSFKCLTRLDSVVIVSCLFFYILLAFFLSWPHLAISIKMYTASGSYAPW